MEFQTSTERFEFEKACMQGRREEASKLLILMIENRFGTTLDVSFSERLENLWLESLEQLCFDIMDFKSIDEIDQRIEQYS